jgi:hypothetical protein
MRRYLAIVRLMALAGVASLAAQPARANLILNPSFESGAFVNQANQTMSLPAGAGQTIADWTVGFDTIAWINAGNPFLLTAQDGDKFLDLTNYEAGAPFGGVNQTIATTVGSNYVLTFYLGSYTTLWGGPPVSITAFAGSATQQCSVTTPTTASTWTLCTVPFTALAAQTTITLHGVSGVNYIGLDQVSVELAGTQPPVPEPAVSALLGLGALALATKASRRRKKQAQ